MTKNDDDDYYFEYYYYYYYYLFDIIYNIYNILQSILGV
jgi:hypothetical protein